MNPTSHNLSLEYFQIEFIPLLICSLSLTNMPFDQYSQLLKDEMNMVDKGVVFDILAVYLKYLFCYLRTLDNLRNCLYRIDICTRVSDSPYRFSLFAEGSAFGSNTGIVTYGPVENNEINSKLREDRLKTVGSYLGYYTTYWHGACALQSDIRVLLQSNNFVLPHASKYAIPELPKAVPNISMGGISRAHFEDLQIVPEIVRNAHLRARNAFTRIGSGLVLNDNDRALVACFRDSYNDWMNEVNSRSRLGSRAIVSPLDSMIANLRIASEVTAGVSSSNNNNRNAKARRAMETEVSCIRNYITTHSTAFTVSQDDRLLLESAKLGGVRWIKNTDGSHRVLGVMNLSTNLTAVTASSVNRPRSASTPPPAKRHNHVSWDIVSGVASATGVTTPCSPGLAYVDTNAVTDRDASFGSWSDSTGTSGASTSTSGLVIPKRDLRMPPGAPKIDLTGPSTPSGSSDPEHHRRLLDALTHVTSLVADGYVQDVEMAIGLIRNRMA